MSVKGCVILLKVNRDEGASLESENYPINLEARGNNMLEGILWKVHFTSPTDYGNGIVAFNAGKIYGGDSSYYYHGSYDLDGSSLIIITKVQRYSPDTYILVNSQEITVSLFATVVAGKIVGSGSVIENPILKLNIELSPLETI